MCNRTNNNNGMPRQDKGTLSEKVIRKTVPVIRSGQSSNWNEDMENGEARFCSFSAPERKIKF